MMWLFDKATERAKAYGIEGVTFTLTTVRLTRPHARSCVPRQCASPTNHPPPPPLALAQGVAKSIIPAIASTNAVIASLCVLEALKLVSGASQTLNHWWAYFGHEGLSTSVQDFARRAECLACGGRVQELAVARGETLGSVRSRLREALHLDDPTLGAVDAATDRPRALYYAKPPALRDATAANLDRRIDDELGLAEGTRVVVNDATMAEELGPLTVVLRYRERRAE